MASLTVHAVLLPFGSLVPVGNTCDAWGGFFDEDIKFVHIRGLEVVVRSAREVFMLSQTLGGSEAALTGMW